MDKKTELIRFLASKGIISPADQDAEIAKMAQQCPTATANEKGLTDDVDKAYEVMQIQQGTAVNPAAGTEQTQVAPTTGISATEQLNITKAIAQQQANRTQVSQTSSIDNLILDRPAPKDIIPAGTKGVIVESSWKNLLEKVEKGELVVCPDDGEDIPADKRIASTTNWNTLKKAAEAKTEIDVYTGNLNTKPIGYTVRKGSNVGQVASPVQMTREDLQRFLTLETAGYILAGDATPGAKLKSVKAKKSATTPGAVSPKKTVLADANKKAAIENNAYVVSRAVTKEQVSATCKSALRVRFQVPGQTLKDGVTPKTVTKRVSVTADIFTTERKPEFIDKFGTGISQSNSNLTETPDAKEQEKILEAQVRAIAELRRKAKDPAEVAQVADISEQLAAFDGVSSQPGNVAM